MSTSVHDNLLDNHDISIKTAIFIENEKVAVAFTLTSTLRCPHCGAILKGHGKHARSQFQSYSYFRPKVLLYLNFHMTRNFNKYLFNTVLDRM